MSEFGIPPGVPLNEIPLAPNPNGSPPNFIDPPTLVPAVISVGVIFGVWATIFMILRLYNNVHTSRGFGVDDGLALFALIIAHCYLGLGISFGAGHRHTWDVPLSMFTPEYSMKTTVTGIIAGPGIGMAKAAILVTQLRLFSTKPWFRWTSYAGIAFITIVHWSNVPVYAALCTPRSGEDWGVMVMLRCAKTSIHQVVVGPLSTAFDIFLFVLPLTIITRLQISAKVRLGLILTFGTGLIAIVASAVSLYYRVELWKNRDIMWNGAINYILTFIEYYIAIIVGCAPAMLSFWRHTLRDSSAFTTLRRLLYASRSGSQSTLAQGDEQSKGRLNSGESHSLESLSHKKGAEYQVQEVSRSQNLNNAPL